jgi:hypothetical protein
MMASGRQLVCNQKGAVIRSVGALTLPAGEVAATAAYRLVFSTYILANNNIRNKNNQIARHNLEYRHFGIVWFGIILQ